MHNVFFNRELNRMSMLGARLRRVEHDYDRAVSLLNYFASQKTQKLADQEYERALEELVCTRMAWQNAALSAVKLAYIDWMNQ